MPTFMDVFASFSQTEYINVGLKWSVAESKAAMAYATRASIGHSPIKADTDDYHIEAFSSSAAGAPADFTKMRFRQKDVYSGTLGFAQPDNTQPGVFQFTDNTKKAFATVKTGKLDVQNDAVVTGDITYNGKLSGKGEVSVEKSGTFGGTTLGSANGGEISRMEAAEGTGLGLYTRIKGGTVDEKVPRVFVADGGNVGVGTTTPSAKLEIASANTALKVASGTMSVGETSAFQVDGNVKGSTAAGLRFTIKADGNVGVNTASPTDKFHVAGGVKVDSGDTSGPTKTSMFITNTKTECDHNSLRVKDHFYVTGCGKVGVKTATPTEDFVVAGTAQSDNLKVTKDATISGKLSVAEFEAHGGKFQAGDLVIDKTTTLKGHTIMEADVVMKGNLYVSKEVKMVGGPTSEERMMMESRIALLEESNSNLKESHQALQDSHAAVKKHNEALQDRLARLEAKLEAM
jgi:cytoskeletal protein CcmA (bactofilin family)